MYYNILFALTGMLLVPMLSFSQATVLSNNGVNGNYLGWNSATGVPLELKVFNQNAISIDPAAAEGMTTSGEGVVVGLGAQPIFDARLWIRDSFLQGNTRRNLHASMTASSLSVPNSTFGGQFSIRGDGQIQRGVSSLMFQGSVPSNVIISVLARLESVKGTAVYARATATQTTQGWAGWFEGDVYHVGSFLPPSDENLKTEIEDLANATDLIMELNPKRYKFRTEEFAHMKFPRGNHYGFIAQDVESVMPELVATFKSPTKYSESGDILDESEKMIIHESFEFKTLRYQDFIPIVVQSLNEREAIIAQQTETIAELENQILQLQSQNGE